MKCKIFSQYLSFGSRIYFAIWYTLIFFYFSAEALHAFLKRSVNVSFDMWLQCTLGSPGETIVSFIMKLSYLIGNIFGQLIFRDTNINEYLFYLFVSYAMKCKIFSQHISFGSRIYFAISYALICFNYSAEALHAFPKRSVIVSFDMWLQCSLD